MSPPPARLMARIVAALGVARRPRAEAAALTTISPMPCFLISENNLLTLLISLQTDGAANCRVFFLQSLLSFSDKNLASQ